MSDLYRFDFTARTYENPDNRTTPSLGLVSKEKLPVTNKTE